MKIFENYWNKLTPGERIFAPICLINILVFLAWRIPRLQPFMLKYFCSNPGGSSTCLPMLLSTFSHYSAVHLMANMYVLHSFSTGKYSIQLSPTFNAIFSSNRCCSNIRQRTVFRFILGCWSVFQFYQLCI